MVSGEGGESSAIICSNRLAQSKRTQRSEERSLLISGESSNNNLAKCKSSNQERHMVFFTT